jgi:hypothetical protein
MEKPLTISLLLIGLPGGVETITTYCKIIKGKQGQTNSLLLPLVLLPQNATIFLKLTFPENRRKQFILSRQPPNSLFWLIYRVITWSTGYDET